jgi:hypothetical protein
MQQLQALRAQVRRHKRIASQISTRMGETCDQADADRIAGSAKDDRDCGRGLLCRKSGWRTGGYNDIDLVADQFCSQFIQTFSIAFCRFSFQDKIFAFHIAKLRELASEGHGKRRA